MIDRLFPQVRLSKLSGTVIRGAARTCSIRPAERRELHQRCRAARDRLGSRIRQDLPRSVRLPATAVQAPDGARARRPTGRGARVFARWWTTSLVEDLPASERFFAGGDTTVRGFSLDRLGTTETITSSGFPTGGNAVVILNAELRHLLGRCRRSRSSTPATSTPRRTSST